jgi:hypothetical protein
MNSIRRSLILVICLAQATFPVSAEVKNDFEPDAPFPQYKTFSFVKGIELDRGTLLQDPSIRERIKNLISGALEIRGLREIPRDEKYDLAVRYWVSRTNKMDVSYVPVDNWAGWGGFPPFWDGPWYYTYAEVTRNYQQGTLIVDLLDPSTKQLIWRTYVRENYNRPYEAVTKAQKDMAKAFAKYPPSKSDIEKMRSKRKKENA